MIRITYRPLPIWPYTETRPREAAKFTVGLDRTMNDLRYEVDRLDGREVVIGIGYLDHEVRMDGTPRRDARRPRHPGVEVSFDSRHGRLSYATDIYVRWEDNLRGVTLALEALRAIDRYGVSKRGQQYAGFSLLTAGPSLEDLGRQLVELHGGVQAALRATHPDTGGATASARDFQAVMAFRDRNATPVPA